METNFEPFRKWFGFSRRERRSSFILLLMIILTFSIRYVIPRSGMSVEELSASVYPELIPAGKYSGSASNDSDAVTDKRRIMNKTSTWKESNQSRKDTSSPVSARNYQAKKELIELNSADSALLESLPGIGPVLSVRAVKYRELLGGFCSVNQMKEVYGLSEETFLMIEERLRVDTLKIRKIDVNMADYGQLLRHPYLEKYDVTAILKFRELKGRITGIHDLTANKLLSSEKASRLRPYLNFE